MKPYLLLVDDHPHNLITLEAVLGTSDYNLVTASSGKEALTLIDRHDFALVLLDVHMPEMDGYEVTQKLKASPKTRHIPIIMITSVYREDPHVSKAYSVGAVDFFSKPFNPDVLRVKVGIYADLYRKNHEMRLEEEKRLQMKKRLATLEEQELRRQRDERHRTAELRTILESIPEAVYVGDEHGITRCNRAALSLFGFSSENELTRPDMLAERMQMRYADSGEPIPFEDQPYSHALRGEAFLGNIVILHGETGEDELISCAAAPVRIEGAVLGAVVIHALKETLDVGKQPKTVPRFKHEVRVRIERP